jgi:O-antigen ligase
MSGDSNLCRRAAFWCALGAAATSMCSIAASQTLLGMSLAAMIAGRVTPRLPRGWPFLAFFALATAASLLMSPEPAAGIPQIRKLYVLLILIAVASTFAGLRHVRWLVSAWIALGAAAAATGFWQFGAKWLHARSAGQDFYLSYVGARITGFMSHWMTFSGQMMIVLLVGGALFLLGRIERRTRLLVLAALAFAALALVLGFTRGIWLATAAATVYLLGVWRRWAVLLVPLAAGVVLAAGPESLRARALSLVRPRGQVDSNQHRIVTFRTGLRMIEAHPLIGVGPERVGREFMHYLPPDIKPPLPEGYYGHLHNIYVHYAAERGIPATLGMIGFLLAALLQWIRAVRRGAGRDPERRWILHGGIALLIGILAAGFFEHNLGDSEILMMTMAAVAAVDLAAKEQAGV